MKIVVKVDIPDEENCDKCLFFEEYGCPDEWCELFGCSAEDKQPCKPCIMARYGVVKNRSKNEKI